MLRVRVLWLLAAQGRVLCSLVFRSLLVCFFDNDSGVCRRVRVRLQLLFDAGRLPAEKG